MYVAADSWALPRYLRVLVGGAALTYVMDHGALGGACVALIFGLEVLAFVQQPGESER